MSCQCVPLETSFCPCHLPTPFPRVPSWPSRSHLSPASPYSGRTLLAVARGVCTPVASHRPVTGVRDHLTGRAEDGTLPRHARFSRAERYHRLCKQSMNGGSGCGLLSPSHAWCSPMHARETRVQTCTRGVFGGERGLASNKTGKAIRRLPRFW